MESFINNLFSDPEMLRMGHGQRKDDLNLGLGWLYYGFTRAIKPSTTVVIGSYRGFSPIVFAQAMQDNLEKGKLHFIDPSLADDFWMGESKVRDYFSSWGIQNVQHHQYTTQKFTQTKAYRDLENIGILMVDGYHSAEQARIDYLAFLDKLSDEAVVFFHDSVGRKKSKFYGEDKIYDYSVCDFIERLDKTPGLEVITIPIGSGVSIVRGVPKTLEVINQSF